MTLHLLRDLAIQLPKSLHQREVLGNKCKHASRLVHQKKIRHVVLKNKLSSNKFLLFNLRRLFTVSLMDQQLAGAIERKNWC
ncbi:hypothetical protein C5167_029551 [Papaver somniferum]|nr:hypothetical protein C5167_029551 [Papaver somniferum]